MWQQFGDWQPRTAPGRRLGALAGLCGRFEKSKGGASMRTYERPTLTAAGSFRKTGLGVVRGPEFVVPARFSL